METLELIDKYIDNQLAYNQAAQLEKELQEDADLQRLLDSVVMSRDAIRFRAVSHKVKGLHKKYITELRAQPDEDNVRPMPVRRDYTYPWASRLAASVLIGLFGYGAYQYADLDTNRVYDDKFISYHLPTPRGSADHLSRLGKLYSSGKYADVIQQFGASTSKAPSDYFLTGVAYLQRHQYEQAITKFMALRAINKQQGEVYFSEETEYYLALAYLGAGKIDKAYALFKSIHDSPRHLFYELVTDIDLLKLNILRLKERFAFGN